MLSQANNMSKLKTGILLFVSLVEMTLFSAPLLGWPLLLIILKEERIASHLCEIVVTRAHNETSQELPGRESTMCSEQEKSLNLSHNFTVIVGSVYTFIAGWAIDKYGAKAVKIFSSAMYSVTAGLFVFTSSRTPELLTPALVSLCIAHVGIFLSIVKSSVLYGKWQSTVNSIFICALSSSAVTFLIFKVLYEQGVTYQILCQGLLYSSLLLLLSSIVIFPSIPRDEHEHIKQPKTREIKKESSWETVKNLIVHMKSGIFIVTCIFVGMCRLRLFFFVTTFQQFILALPNMDIHSVRQYSDYYGIIQLCSLAVCPFIAALVTAAVRMSRRSLAHHQEITMLSDKNPSCRCETVVGIDVIAAARAAEVRGCTVYYACSGLLLIILNLLTVLPNAPLQIFSFLLVTLLRCFYNGGFSNLFLVAFPGKHFGKLFGIGSFLCSGIQMLQLPLFDILETYFPLDIMKFNLSFLLVSIPLGIGYPCYLWYFARRLNQDARSRDTTHSCDYAMERLMYERVTVL